MILPSRARAGFISPATLVAAALVIGAGMLGYSYLSHTNSLSLMAAAASKTPPVVQLASASDNPVAENVLIAATGTTAVVNAFIIKTSDTNTYIRPVDLPIHVSAQTDAWVLIKDLKVYDGTTLIEMIKATSTVVSVPTVQIPYPFGGTNGGTEFKVVADFNPLSPYYVSGQDAVTVSVGPLAAAYIANASAWSVGTEVTSGGTSQGNPQTLVTH